MEEQPTTMWDTLCRTSYGDTETVVNDSEAQRAFEWEAFVRDSRRGFEGERSPNRKFRLEYLAWSYRYPKTRWFYQQLMNEPVVGDLFLKRSEREHHIAARPGEGGNPEAAQAYLHGVADVIELIGALSVLQARRAAHEAAVREQPGCCPEIQE